MTKEQDTTQDTRSPITAESIQRIDWKELVNSNTDDFKKVFSLTLREIGSNNPELSEAFVDHWNKFREENPDIEIDLSNTDLEGVDLAGANLVGACLAGAYLKYAGLGDAKLNGANLESSNLRGADLRGADLRSANLPGARLNNANLTGADLVNANLTGANLYRAVFSDLKNVACMILTGVKGLTIYQMKAFMKAPGFDQLVMGLEEKELWKGVLLENILIKGAGGRLSGLF